MINLVLKIIQSLAASLLGTKGNYLNAPDHILKATKIHNISILGHFFPSVIFTIITVVYSLPYVSDTYAKHLVNNDASITVTAILIFIPVLIINGVIIERILMNTNSNYLLYAREGNSDHHD